MQTLYDVVVIGGGAVGSAIARELTRWKLKVTVLEKNLDVCCETSGRNSGVVHGGFAYDTGSLKARLCVEGNRGMDALAEELDFPFRRCGKLLVGSTPEDRASLERTMAQGARNGAAGLELVDEAGLHALAPAVVGKFAMFSKNSGIVDPFLYTIALAESAACNGAEYRLGWEAVAIARGADGVYEVAAAVCQEAGGPARRTVRGRWVVNAAGLGCRAVSDMLGLTGYRVIGSKGEYIVLDKRVGPLLPLPVYPVPSNTYMGVHVTNTIDGNVIVGPNAEDTQHFSDYSVTGAGTEFLAESASRLWPHIRRADYIRCYAGILPKWVDGQGVIQDFKIEIRDDVAPRAVNLVGIESPGLTAAVPIARYVVEQIGRREELAPNPAFEPRRRGIPRFAELPRAQQAALIAQDAAYGDVVCRCETVTRAQLRQAIHNPLGVHTMAGIKYRTRSMMGRCQGGYCQMRLEQMIEQELGTGPRDVRWQRPGGWVLCGTVREE